MIKENTQIRRKLQEMASQETTTEKQKEEAEAAREALKVLPKWQNWKDVTSDKRREGVAKMPRYVSTKKRKRDGNREQKSVFDFMAKHKIRFVESELGMVFGENYKLLEGSLGWAMKNFACSQEVVETKTPIAGKTNPKNKIGTRYSVGLESMTWTFLLTLLPRLDAYPLALRPVAAKMKMATTPQLAHYDYEFDTLKGKRTKDSTGKRIDVDNKKLQEIDQTISPFPWLHAGTSLLNEQPRHF